MAVTEKHILEALGAIEDADFQKDIVTLGYIRQIAVRNSAVSLDLVVPTPKLPSKEAMRDRIEKLLKTLPGVTEAKIRLISEITAHAAPSSSPLRNIKNIVAIASGKGGVGKSTVAVNIAVGLAQRGARVGLVDGDIYGPTIPIMMGARAHELQQRDGRIIPVEAHGVRFMSMGFLAAGNQPLIWRGPMAHRAVQQSLLEVEWGDLDYLIVDMPPGTGDVHLTLVQTVSLTGAVIVSTPQDVGLIISLKTFKMFEQTHVHPLGLIENMSFHVCTHCGEREDIFGHGIVAEESLRLKVPFLGEIPLDVNIRKHADQGLPIILADPDTPAAMAYLAIIDRLAGQIAVKNHNAKPLTILEEAEPAPRSFSV